MQIFSPAAHTTHTGFVPITEMQEADPIEAYRLQANLKSIHRSDTAVQAILSSSNYATIYHYEQEAGPTGEGEWVKQKAEGPLFVVKR